METDYLKQLVTTLNNSNKYRVIEKYQRPQFYNTNDPGSKLIGVFLDIETTGLSPINDKLLELGMVKFEYNEDGCIFHLLDEFNKYQDPNMIIPEHITKLTGITDVMVKDQQINVDEVVNYLQNVDLIIAHNAQFDRAFLELTFPSISPKAWACLMYDIDWKYENVASRKLEYIAFKYNFFYEGHRAIIDCSAGIHILTQYLLNSKQLVLKQLLTNSQKLRFKLWATNAAYQSKDSLKERGYRWDNNSYKAWHIEPTEDKVTEEIHYLRSKIYNCSTINIPIEIFDAYSRFSPNVLAGQTTAKYQDKLKWVQMLCNK